MGCTKPDRRMWRQSGIRCLTSLGCLVIPVPPPLLHPSQFFFWLISSFSLFSSSFLPILIHLSQAHITVSIISATYHSWHLLPASRASEVFHGHASPTLGVVIFCLLGRDWIWWATHITIFNRNDGWVSPIKIERLTTLNLFRWLFLVPYVIYVSDLDGYHPSKKSSYFYGASGFVCAMCIRTIQD